MIILVMKNPSAPTETTIVMVANANELITAMVLWKLKFLRIANQPFSHKWLKSVRKISPILIRRLSLCMPKEWRPDRYLKPLRIFMALKLQKDLSSM